MKGVVFCKYDFVEFDNVCNNLKFLFYVEGVVFICGSMIWFGNWEVIDEGGKVFFIFCCVVFDKDFVLLLGFYIKIGCNFIGER